MLFWIWLETLKPLSLLRRLCLLTRESLLFLFLSFLTGNQQKRSTFAILSGILVLECFSSSKNHLLVTRTNSLVFVILHISLTRFLICLDQEFGNWRAEFHSLLSTRPILISCESIYTFHKVSLPIDYCGFWSVLVEDLRLFIAALFIA